MSRTPLYPAKETLHAPETTLQKRLDAQIRTHLAKHNAVIGPLDDIRIAEICFLLRWAVSFEHSLLEQRANPPLPADPLLEDPPPAKPSRRAAKTVPLADPISPSTIESIAKLWERARKAIGELEERCADATGAAKPIALADALLPLLQKTRGVLEETLQE